jgi:hypothetical protein
VNRICAFSSRHKIEVSQVIGRLDARTFDHHKSEIFATPHRDLLRNSIIPPHKLAATMAPISLTDIISALPSEDSWGPPTSTETTLNGVPYAPYSKGDKLGRMADWTTEGKDGRDGRGGRQQYNRNYRGWFSP